VAEIVGAFGVPHTPYFPFFVERDGPECETARYFAALRAELEALKPDVLLIFDTDHLNTFFFDNLPIFAIGVTDQFTGACDEVRATPLYTVKSRADLAAHVHRACVAAGFDPAVTQKFAVDHSVIVPLHFLTPRYDLPVIPVNINCQGPPLTPLSRVWAFGEALRRAADAMPERIALVCTGGISHWPCTPDSGKVNAAWDREFLDRWTRNDRTALLDYDDAAVYRDAGQGGFEIRTLITAAAAANGAKGAVWFYEPIPIFAVGCTVAVMEI
jgi:2,3-dihydroxyphenylpropionate 1,2-dioxygenase